MSGTFAGSTLATLNVVSSGGSESTEPSAASSSGPGTDTEWRPDVQATSG